MAMISTFTRVLDRLRQHVDRVRWAADWTSLYRLYRPPHGRHVVRTKFGGRQWNIYVRGNTLDAQIAQLILREDSEYRLPVTLEPKVIFDVGANIGTAAIYFAATYPDAQIYCFEPLPENIELLRLNTACFADRIKIIPKGLGDIEGGFAYQPSNDSRNFGGGTFHQVGSAANNTIELPVTTVANVCRDFGIDQVDVFKIDTEGAEMSVIRGVSPHMLANVSVLIGELHGVEDWALCEMLSQTHRVGVRKHHNSRCFPFVAVNKSQQLAISRQALGLAA